MPGDDHDHSEHHHTQRHPARHDRDGTQGHHQRQDGSPNRAASSDPDAPQPARHIFILVGEKTHFLCHQLALHRDHRMEAVLEAKLSGTDWDRLLKRRKQGRTIFLANVTGDMSTLHAIINGENGEIDAEGWDYFPARADWDMKHFWPWAEKAVFREIRATEVKCHHSRHLGATAMPQAHEQYRLFGKGGEAHLYHMANNRPDYDHVASLASVPEGIDPARLEGGLCVEFLALPWEEGSIPCCNPLPSGRYEVRENGKHQTFQIDVGRTHWFSTRILTGPQDPCPDGGDVPIPGNAEGVA